MDKREKEMRTVYEMIHLYCRKKHKEKELCPECLDLYEYAKMRIEKCPFMETKTFCSQCKVHCYRKDKRKQIDSQGHAFFWTKNVGVSSCHGDSSFVLPNYR